MHPLDVTIRVLTIVKLIFQLAFYGLLIGGTIWFVVKNPLPQLIQQMQAQMVAAFLRGGK